MRLWQKTYLAALVLFLIFLDSSVFLLAYYTYSEVVLAAEASCDTENAAIVRALKRDYDDVLEMGSSEESIPLLLRSYDGYYRTRQIRFRVYNGDRELFDALPDGIRIPGPDASKLCSVDGVRYFVINNTVEGLGQFVYAKDVSSLDEKFRTLMTVFLCVSTGASVLLAACLFVALKRLSVPLEKLRRTSETIAGGDLSVRADESGRDEVAALAKSFNVMVDALRLDARRKQALVENMAHELRTPLTTIRGYADYLEKAPVAAEGRQQALAYIQTEADRLESVAEKLLDGAFIRENGISPRPVDLPALLEETGRRLTPRAEKSGVYLTLDTRPGVVDGDPALLSVLVGNLVENAVKASNPGSTVTLFCDGKTVAVVDRGKGMTPEQLSHITEPFYRTDKARSRAEGGTGLGLALCKQIADAHRATLSFTSAPGEGTTALVEFP